MVKDDEQSQRAVANGKEKFYNLQIIRLCG
jgi:hypothetical protein